MWFDCGSPQRFIWACLPKQLLNSRSTTQFLEYQTFLWAQCAAVSMSVRCSPCLFQSQQSSILIYYKFGRKCKIAKHFVKTVEDVHINLEKMKISKSFVARFKFYKVFYKHKKSLFSSVIFFTSWKRLIENFFRFMNSQICKTTKQYWLIPEAGYW